MIRPPLMRFRCLTSPVWRSTDGPAPRRRWRRRARGGNRRMRLVPLSEVLDGAVIGRDVLGGRDRAPLLRAGIRLSPEYRDGLVRAGVRAVYIEDESSEGITPLQPLLSEETQERAAQAVAETYAEAKTALEANRALDPAVSERLGSTLELMLAEVKSHGDAAVALR